MKVEDMESPVGGMSHTLDFTLFGIHSTKYDEFLFCTFIICWSTSFVLIFPRNIADAVRYRPCRGSAAHIMLRASHICWVSSGMVRDRYCWEPREVSGAKPTMKKCSRGKGMRFTASFRRSELSWPGKRRQQVTPLIVVEIKWFRSPTAFIHSFISVLLHSHMKCEQNITDNEKNGFF